MGRALLLAQFIKRVEALTTIVLEEVLEQAGYLKIFPGQMIAGGGGGATGPSTSGSTLRAITPGNATGAFIMDGDMSGSAGVQGMGAGGSGIRNANVGSIGDLVREVVECLEILLFLVLLVLAGLVVAVEGQQRQKTKA